MAITHDGSQEFGITETGFGSLVVESFAVSKTSNRVDLSDGNGEPSGTVIAPGRTEVTATVQVTGAAPAIGGEITLASGYTNMGNTMVITSVEKAESAADYQRLNLPGYIKIN